MITEYQKLCIHMTAKPIANYSQEICVMFVEPLMFRTYFKLLLLMNAEHTAVAPVSPKMFSITMGCW